MSRTVCICVLGAVLLCGWARADEGPQAAVESHFAAITAEDYTAADRWLSRAFIRAFKADVVKLNAYYTARRAQLARGYTIMDSHALSDPGRETAAVVVEFGDPHPEAVVNITERMYYYLIREKAAADAPGVDSRGLAWRIDIFDALGFDTLADARRNHYLGTREAWDEDMGRELRSRQGLFRIQWALTQYAGGHGQYPLRLLGEENRRDELITAGYLTGAYPLSGYSGKAMRSVGVTDSAAGDFTYLSIDANGDGQPEGYWLLLHGKDPSKSYFRGLDIVYVLGSSGSLGQNELAQEFAAFWQATAGAQLELTGASEPLVPQGGLVPTPEQAGLEVPVAPGTETPEPAAAETPAEQVPRTAPEEAPVSAAPEAAAPSAGEAAPTPPETAPTSPEAGPAPPAEEAAPGPEGAGPSTEVAVPGSADVHALAQQVGRELAAKLAALAGRILARIARAPLPVEPLVVHTYGFR